MAVTIKDIAKTLGVSHVTVSKALRGQSPISVETCNRVRNIAEKLGYKPNLLSRGLKTGKAQAIGMIMDAPNHEVSMLKFGAINDQAVLHGFGIFSNFHSGVVEWEKRNMQELLDRQVDGLIIFPAERTDGSHFLPLIQQKKPLVFVSPDFPFPVNQVGTDYIEGGQFAIRHLVEQGRRKPAFIAGGIKSSLIQERIRGWRQGCQEAGIDFSSCPFYFEEMSGDSEDLYRLARRMMDSKCSFDAIVASNDVGAANAMRALFERGIRVPDDVAVIGFDNNMFGTCLSVPLTTIEQPVREIGETAFEMLLRHIENPSAPLEQVILKPRLIVRNSTGCNTK
jgi:LacI family transcriptional regulator